VTGGSSGFGGGARIALGAARTAQPRPRAPTAPYLARLIQGYRAMGFYTIKHTDGDSMPILDQLVQANPHALHSLDPQAGVDIAEVKRSSPVQWVCLHCRCPCICSMGLHLLPAGSRELCSATLSSQSLNPAKDEESNFLNLLLQHFFQSLF
jgi:hypothetical protein